MSITILIVEDDLNNSELLKYILEKNGYSVIVLNSGLKFFETLENNKIDLVLLDIMMPEIDGLTLCKQLREKEKYYELPVIFLSAKTDIKDKIEGLNAGAVDYVTKPYDRKELLLRISNQLRVKEYNNMLYERDMLKHTNELIMNLAQNINNPLSIILGSCQYLTLDMDKDTELYEYLKIIEKNANKINSFLTSMRENTKLKSIDFNKHKNISVYASKKEEWEQNTALVIDDEDSLAKLYVKFLDMYNFKVDIVNRGNDAIGMCKKKNYHLIFVDMLLPDMDGLEIFRKIKKSYLIRNVRLPFIIMNSGYDVEDKFLKAIEEGAYTSFYKPIDIFAFRNMIDEILKKSNY